MCVRDQDVSKLLLHYIAKYGNTWSYFHRACCFSLNSFPVGHLCNISPYEILYGRKPPVLSDLQLLSDNMTKPFSYNFADYLDLLNERFRAIRSMVTNLHNEQVTNRHAVHGAESPTLRDFHEGDIVYCHFPSKSLIAELGIQSRKIKMDYVGPLYVYSKFDKFQFVLSTIDGEVIEQLFHVARLKKGLLRLPNGKTASNIKDYLNIKSDLQNELHKTTTTNSGGLSADNAEPRHSLLNTKDSNKLLAWYKEPEAVYMSNMDVNARTSQQCHFSSIASLEVRPNIKPVLLYENKIAHWADEFSTDAFGEMLAIICKCRSSPPKNQILN